MKKSILITGAGGFIGGFLVEESVEVIIAGYQKKNRVMSDKEKMVVAYHEIGHALVAAYTGIQSPVRVACLYLTMLGLHLEVLNAEVDQIAEGWKSSFFPDGSGLPEFW